MFYIDPGPVPGTSKAYWGPEIRIGTPQPALDLSLDGPHNNVESLSFTFDKERKELPIVFIQEPLSKVPIPIPIPDVTPLNPPLGVLGPLPAEDHLPQGHRQAQPDRRRHEGHRLRRAALGLGVRLRSLDVARYGHVLRSRGLVGVRGAGEAFDGLHYVTSVTSSLKRGEFTQSFSLARNALLSTLPEVPT